MLQDNAKNVDRSLSNSVGEGESGIVKGSFRGSERNIKEFAPKNSSVIE